MPVCSFIFSEFFMRKLLSQGDRHLNKVKTINVLIRCIQILLFSFEKNMECVHRTSAKPEQ